MKLNNNIFTYLKNVLIKQIQLFILYAREQDQLFNNKQAQNSFKTIHGRFNINMLFIMLRKLFLTISIHNIYV